MIEYVNDARRTMTNTWPRTSTLRALGARDSGMKMMLSTIAITPTGTLIQQMDRQPMELTSTPPSTGPRAMLTPITAPQMPMAKARSFGIVKVLVMIAIATGFNIEPPTAWSMRNTMSRSRFGATLHRSEPATKIASPMRKVRRRPMRSAVDPDSMSRLARTRV